MPERSLTLAFPLSSTVIVRIRSQIGRLLAPVARFYGRLRVGRGWTGAPDVAISVEARGGRFFIVTPFTSYRLTPEGNALQVDYVDSACPEPWSDDAWRMSSGYLRTCSGVDEPDPTLSHVTGLIERVLLSTVSEFAGGFECLHAACVALAEKCVLIVGESESGKTTTSMALAAEGWRLLTDDTAFYNPNTREVFPLDRRPMVRNRRISELDLYSFLDFRLCKERKNRLQQSLKPEYRYQERSARASDVLFLSGRGPVCTLSEFSPALGLLRVAKASCARRHDPRRDLVHLASAFANVAWWECRLGTPGESARTITSVLGRAGPRAAIVG
jgi:hypothetical protein